MSAGKKPVRDNILPSKINYITQQVKFNENFNHKKKKKITSDCLPVKSDFKVVC